jgi:hypothetical protein
MVLSAADESTLASMTVPLRPTVSLSAVTPHRPTSLAILRG